MVRIIDISMPIEASMAVYKNKPEKRPQLERTRDHGEGARESRLHMDLHTGTHIDAQLHMIPDGQAISDFDVQNAITLCRVLDLTEVEDVISPFDLEQHHVQAGEFILLKTKNSFRDDFDPQFVFVGKQAAAYLADKGIRGIGVDALGIERDQPGHDTHGALLQKGVEIIEGLRLAHVAPGEYTLVAAPLNVVDGDAAPARVLLVHPAVK